MKVLIVEDDLTSRELLVALLKRNRYEVTAVGTGDEGWDELSKQDAPNLIVLDWLMPGLSGMELCKRIRAVRTDNPPYIIMLTIKGKKEEVVEGLEAGADDYVAKPYDPGELRARVDVGARMLELRGALAARVEEKEILIHEVHHRMKNNMNTIRSILQLHAATLKDPIAVAALLDANNRLASMSLLYDKLYRSENVRSMSVRNYLPQLVEEIVEQFPNAGAVRVDAAVDDFQLGAKRLTNLGIIVNELTTNAMKHAFADGHAGLIRIAATMQRRRATLIFEDDGPGIPSSTGLSNSSGFGLRLVSLLVSQIDGDIRVERGKGARFVIDFDTE